MDDLTPNEIVQNNIVRFDPIVHTIVPPPLDPSLIAPGTTEKHGAKAKKD